MFRSGWLGVESTLRFAKDDGFQPVFHLHFARRKMIRNLGRWDYLVARCLGM